MRIEIDASTLEDKCEIVCSGKSIKAYLIERDQKPDEIRSAVYILMDKRRTCFYIGECGNTTQGGFKRRFQSHRTKKESWWDLALCFVDTSGLFDKPPVRKWLESRLNEIARNSSVVISTAGSSDKDASNETILDDILGVCSLLGIPWLTKLLNPRTKQSVTWKNATALAKEIATKYNNGKAMGYATQLLTRRAAVAKGKWRDILLKCGLEFDNKGYVVDWRVAKV